MTVDSVLSTSGTTTLLDSKTLDTKALDTNVLDEASLLEKVPDAATLRAMDPDQLASLAAEIRALIIAVVARNGGHLGSNLGAIELTLALHRVFDSPRDRILFDTGHQAYAHKLLTGRRDRFETLRRPGGLSGYPSQAESEHDLIENSHASTALSYADGLAKAHRLRDRDDRAVVAVVGDGALTGGMAWEALNNIGAADRPVILLLNDNGRSYSPTIGGLAAHLSRCRAAYTDADAGAHADAAEPGALFRSLGLAYIGPVDGHDVAELEHALRRARELGRPAVVHAITTKGRGFEAAETDEEERYHAPGKFDPVTGKRAAANGTAQVTWTSVFGRELVELGAQRPDLVAMTAAMLHPTGLAAFQKAYPERTFDVGIAEQHAVTSAAGLAMGGMRPVIAVYATFLNRAFDQVLMDAALHNLGITLVLDRAGITGDDGPSHHGMWDLSVLQVVPGLAVAAPRDATRLRELLREAVTMDGPNAVRFPKGPVPADIQPIGRLGAADILRRDADPQVLIVAVGPMAAEALDAAALLAEQGIGATVVDPRWAKPLEPQLAAAAARHRLTLVMEDGCRVGGIGDALARLLRDHGVDTPVRTLGLPSRFVEHGSRGTLLAEAGLTAKDIVDQVSTFFARHAVQPHHHTLATAAEVPEEVAVEA
jgi:1-deoxy-D-xylulose-5-phosphate synthase